MTTTYRYKPLDSDNGQIRLLKLSRDWDQLLVRPKDYINTKPLVGKLTHYYFPLSTLRKREQFKRTALLPFYIALSYVWGQDGRTHEIFIDNQVISITKNLFDALRALQAASIDGKPVIWADAICVNQEDRKERSEQITFMRQIYKLAFQVNIWIDKGSEYETDVKRCINFIKNLTAMTEYEEDEDTDEGVTEILLKSLYTTLPPLVHGMGRTAITMARGVELAAKGFEKKAMGFEKNIERKYPENKKEENKDWVNDSKHDLKGKSLLQAKVSQEATWAPSERKLKRVEKEGDFHEIASLIQRTFLEHEWFSRMWVVQEATVNTNNAFLIQGIEVDWMDLTKAIYYLGFIRNHAIEHLHWILGLNLIMSAFGQDIKYPLHELIRECSHREATDPRDKIYALLGLMSDPEDDFLTPNYSDPVGKVYANTTHHLLSLTKTLDLLCSWQTASRHTNWLLPSWTPDFSLSQDQAPSPLVPIDVPISQPLFAASGHDFQSQFLMDGTENPDDEKWGELKVQGIIVDEIVMLSDLGGVEEEEEEEEEEDEDREEVGVEAVEATEKGDEEAEEEKEAENEEDDDEEDSPDSSSDSSSSSSSDDSDDSDDSPLKHLTHPIAHLSKPWYHLILSSSAFTSIPTSSYPLFTHLYSLLLQHSVHASYPQDPDPYNDIKPHPSLFAAYNSNPLFRAYIHTLFSGRISNSERLSDGLVEEFLSPNPPAVEVTPEVPEAAGGESIKSKAWASLSSLHLSPTPTSTTIKSTASSLTSAEEPIPPTTRLKFCTALEAGLKRRRLCITRNGILGSVPEETEVGDSVCVLFGGSVPVVLRKWQGSEGEGDEKREGKGEDREGNGKEGTWRWVGGAYLHGFMDGEALAMEKQGIFQVEEFVLR